MQVEVVHAMGGERFKIKTSPEMTVKDLKKEIAKKARIQPDAIDIIYGVKELSPEHLTLKDFGVTDGATLYIITRVTAG